MATKSATLFAEDVVASFHSFTLLLVTEARVLEQVYDACENKKGTKARLAETGKRARCRSDK
jgi:hypothetical protein